VTGVTLYFGQSRRPEYPSERERVANGAASRDEWGGLSDARTYLTDGTRDCLPRETSRATEPPY